MTENILFLKNNKSGLATSKHPWIFDGAIDLRKSGHIDPGVVHLHTADGRFVAVGTYNPKSAIAFRALDISPGKIDLDFFLQRLATAKSLRDSIIDPNTNGFRWVNSEGDQIPGLTVDTYAGHLVVQVGTPAMDTLSPVWLEAAKQVFHPRSVTRKDSQSIANREHMPGVSDVLWGSPPDIIDFKEAGIRFQASVLPGQKTGFFFDQRENRTRVARLAANKHVFDGYAYTGGFGAHALGAGAAFVTAVESSGPACEMIARNYGLNSDTIQQYEIVNQDCVRYLKQTDRFFDVIVLDPPALAKRRHHLPKAGRLYREIFASGMRRITGEGGFLCACSCSAAVESSTLLEILRQAASEAGRVAQIIHLGGAGADHPIQIHHPEGEYLKSVLLRVI